MDNNWSIEQTKNLFAYVKTASEKGKGLVWAFSKMSDETGRSVNSVRNYYYSQLKMFELVPTLATDLGITLINTQRDEFELFSEAEIRSLVETIVTAKAGGKSVRAAISEMSDGDEKKALRLQNKYRSMITHHRDKVTQIMNELGGKGVEYYNPYSKSIVKEGENVSNYQKLTEYISSLDEKEIDSFFTIMKKLFA